MKNLKDCLQMQEIMTNLFSNHDLKVGEIGKIVNIFERENSNRIEIELIRENKILLFRTTLYFDTKQNIYYFESVIINPKNEMVISVYFDILDRHLIIDKDNTLSVGECGEWELMEFNNNLKREIIAQQVDIIISDELVKVDIVRNKHGNLEIIKDHNNNFPMTYEMYEDELVLSRWDD